MKTEFYKYQGTGNDFVMIDNRSLRFSKENIKLIKNLCDRKFGIGADGLILLENDENADFKMVYFNSDGNQSSMCGNGGRCIVAFAKKLNIIKNETTFIAIDGLHFANIDQENTVSLQMKNVEQVKISDDYVFLNTGSPHHVEIVEELQSLNVKNRGAQIRYSDLYGKIGSNVNFVKQIANDEFSIRTYERGVEDETLSCGTGATAVAIAMNATGKTSSNNIQINVEGGKLEVTFEKENEIYKNVLLKGKAEFVYEGAIFL
jgi:diaminopimelate epimerase